MLKIYWDYCMVLFQRSKLISPCKKSRNRSNYSSFPVQEEANLSVQRLCNYIRGALIRPFQCTDCDYAASQSYSLKHHIDVVHKRPKPFKCPECDYVAGRIYTLNNHIISVHKRLKPFKCLECDYAASVPRNLQRHINNVHKRLKPFKC